MAIIPALFLAYDTSLLDSYHLVKLLVLAIGTSILIWDRPIYKTKLDMPIWTYLGVLVLVSALSQDFLVCLIGQYNFYFNGIFTCVLLTALFYAFIDRDQDEVARWFVGSLVLVSLIGIAQKADYFAPYPLPWDRVYSTIGSPVFLSCLLGMALPVALYLRWFWALLPLLACLWLTQSRSGLLGGSLACLAMLWQMLFNGPRIAHKWLRTGLLALPVLLLAGGWFYAVKSRPTGKADEGRWLLWKISAKAIQAHPIVGYGSEVFQKAIYDYRDAEFDDKLSKTYTNCYAHNQFINALATMGILGLLAHLFLIISIGWYAWKRQDDLLLWPGMAMFVYALFQPVPFHAKAVYAMLLGASITPWQARDVNLAWLLRIACIAISFYLAILYAADRLHYTAIDINNVYLWNRSVTLFPTIFR